MDLIPLITTADVHQRQQGAAVLPIGSFEQHGPSLPLATDTIVSVAIANRLAAAYNVLVLPAVPMSCSHEHAAWPGTVSLTHTTVTAIIGDIASSLAAQGIPKLAIINGHGGNYFLSNVVQTANAANARSMTLFPSRDDWRRARRAADLVTDDHQDMHAGELEVSILSAVMPVSVRDGASSLDHGADDRPFLLVDGMAAYTAHGVIGRPSAGTAEKGEAVLSSLVESFAAHLLALDEPRLQQ
ncbi:creatininase family protein [Actinoplanes sp. NPDC023936]|uniref:creatininase family protein n=1 Tax=Actinoplanes sp. NPDC023936 TaxID=3154910 RepID=UPI0033CF160F